VSCACAAGREADDAKLGALLRISQHAIASFSSAGDGAGGGVGAAALSGRAGAGEVGEPQGVGRRVVGVGMVMLAGLMENMLICVSSHSTHATCCAACCGCLVWCILRCVPIRVLICVSATAALSYV